MIDYAPFFVGFVVGVIFMLYFMIYLIVKGYNSVKKAGLKVKTWQKKHKKTRGF